MAPDLTAGPGPDDEATPPARRPGEILAVGRRPAGGGRVALVEAPRPGEATLRWQSRARSIAEVEQELARIWAEPDLAVDLDGRPGRHVAARTSVLNLVVVAGRGETAAAVEETIRRLTGRHPSRTLVVQAADPDGPPSIEADIRAHCMLPRPDAPETCAELISLVAGGETGRHLAALVSPLLVHDLPVTTWWPGEPPLADEAAHDLLETSDRLIVNGSAWSGDGLARLRQLAALPARHPRLSIADFAQVRQARWREAVASVFDLPEFLPYLPWLRRVAVTYSCGEGSGEPGTVNVVRPLYHAAWIGSRLGLAVERPLAPSAVRRTRGVRGSAAGPDHVHPGLGGTLHGEHGGVAVLLRPLHSSARAGSTLRVELRCERRGSELRADVTAEEENVHVHTWIDGVEALDRVFKARRRSEVDLLGEALEAGPRDPVADGVLALAAALVGPADAPGGPAR